MKIRTLVLAATAALITTACAKKEVAEAPPPPAAPAVVTAPPPPQPVYPGAVTGSVAADRDGDGIIDGYYTPDGIYHPNYTPPPPRQLARSGERG